MYHIRFSIRFNPPMDIRIDPKSAGIQICRSPHSSKCMSSQKITDMCKILPIALTLGTDNQMIFYQENSNSTSGSQKLLVNWQEKVVTAIFDCYRPMTMPDSPISNNQSLFKWLVFCRNRVKNSLN